MANVQSDLLDRYRSIMPSPDAFAALAGQPLRATGWVNPLKLSMSELQSIVPSLLSLPWHINGFSYHGDVPLGQHWAYKVGLLQIQEAVSMLPVRLLDPQPHERVIDLCAAPGNKTAEIAVAMQNTGTVIANDRNYQRMKALGQITRRLGLVNVSVTIEDAYHYPALTGYFDKVLADVPCSCEGTFRKRPHKSVVPNTKQYKKLAEVQQGILRRAIRLCRPGGRIVYSTCTFAPEENEAVLSAVLATHGYQVQMKPITLSAFNWSPGLTEWQGQTYHPDVVHAMRVWPQQNDTGGFFVAVLERTGDTQSVTMDRYQPSPLPQDKQQLLSDLQARFDFSAEVLSPFQFDFASQRGIYIFNRDHARPRALDCDVTGLMCLKTRTQFPKLSTGAAGVIGAAAKQHVIVLSTLQFEAYLARETIVLDADQIRLCESTGFVVVRYKNHTAGMGLYLSATPEKPPRLQSLFPKSI